ncbi:MAG: hypothetical protein JKY37_16975 [Nannocystaceae bacterium]|nr:hypothetical protein [Nannocystaceae bacterium]
MSDKVELLPELDSGLAEMLDAYKLETSRGPAEVAAALEKVSVKLAATTSAGAVGIMSVTTKVVVASVLLSAGAWFTWGVTRDAVPRATHVVTASKTAPAVGNAVIADPETEARPEQIAPPAVPDKPPTRHLAAPPTAPPPTKAKAKPPRVTKSPRVARQPHLAAPPHIAEPEPKNLASLSAELGLLKQARTALRAGRAADALKRVAEHRTSHPTSTFAEERDATEVMALCALGRLKEGRTKAADYKRNFPRSRRDVLATCEAPRQ